MIFRRHTSDQGIRFIAAWEGFRPRPYKPVPGEPYLTIGFGHYGPDVKPWWILTRREARRLLRKDVKWAEKAVRRGVKVRLNQNQFDALVSFTFNCGAGAFSSSTLLRLLNQGNYAAVPSELRKWVNGANGPLPGLMARRKAEGDLFTQRP